MTREKRNNTGRNSNGYAGPGQGQYQRPNTGPYEGQYRGQNAGPYEGQYRKPEAGPYEGQYRGQNTGSYGSQYRDPNAGPYDGQYQGQNAGPYGGQYQGPNVGPRQGQYRGQNAGPYGTRPQGQYPGGGGPNGKKPKKKKTAGDVIQIILLVVAIGIFCFAAFKLATIWLEYKKGTDEYSALEEYLGDEAKSEPKQADPDALETEGVNEDGEVIAASPVDFDSLRKINDEIIGWIKVTALDISYPIAQAEDNEYYLHNTFQKTYNFAGCIFMDYLNNSDMTDPNTLIYGHNMKNGSMFGKLKNFYEEGVYEKSPYFWIYTPDKIYKYEIFSCSEVYAESKTYQMNFESDEDFQKYLNDAVERSVVKSKTAVTSKDKVVTLSTCTGNDATRFIVQGKLIETYDSK